MGPRRMRVLGGDLRAALIAGLATGLALLGSGLTCADEAKTFLGFRLLDLENQSVKWRTPHVRKERRRHLRLRHAGLSPPRARAIARRCFPRPAPTIHLRSAPASSATRSPPLSACGRRWPTSPSARSADPASAGILIGAQAEPFGRAFTNVALKPGTGDKKVISDSLICLNPKQPWKIGFDGRLGVYDLRYTLAHEIGHAIGLDHPSAAGQLMSYRYDEKQTGLQPGDVKGAVLLYGPRASTRRFATTGSSDGNASPDADRGWPFGIGDGRVGSSPKAIQPR